MYWWPFHLLRRKKKFILQWSISFKKIKELESSLGEKAKTLLEENPQAPTPYETPVEEPNEGRWLSLPYSTSTREFSYKSLQSIGKDLTRPIMLKIYVSFTLAAKSLTIMLPFDIKYCMNVHPHFNNTTTFKHNKNRDSTFLVAYKYCFAFTFCLPNRRVHIY